MLFFCGQQTRHDLADVTMADNYSDSNFSESEVSSLPQQRQQNVPGFLTVYTRSNSVHSQWDPNSDASVPQATGYEVELVLRRVADDKNLSNRFAKLLRRRPSFSSQQDLIAYPRRMGAFERVLLLIRMKVGLRRYGEPRGEGVIRIGRRTMLKFREDSDICLREFLTMQYVKRHTTIPVPSIRDVFYGLGGRICFTMDYIDAPELSDLWPDMTPSQRIAIVHELKGYLAQLRGLSPPAAASGRNGIDPSRIRNRSSDAHDDPVALQAVGVKYVLEHHAKNYLRDSVALTRFLSRASRGEYKTVLAHGHFSPKNILIDPCTFRVVSIVDWELAGWYPEYWDCTRGVCMETFDTTYGQAMVDAVAFGKTYSDELAVEHVLNEVFVRVGAMPNFREVP
jgi:hypothetical protein